MRSQVNFLRWISNLGYLYKKKISVNISYIDLFHKIPTLSFMYQIIVEIK